MEGRRVIICYSPCEEDYQPINLDIIAKNHQFIKYIEINTKIKKLKKPKSISDEFLK